MDFGILLGFLLLVVFIVLAVLGIETSVWVRHRGASALVAIEQHHWCQSG